MNHTDRQKRYIATGVGFIAILLWSTLALFTAVSDGIPVFQLLFLTFGIGATANMLWLAITGKFNKDLFVFPVSSWLVSVGGIFLYHFFYFQALFNAPPVEAALINYLWPLLIVVFASLLPGAILAWYKIVGALIAFVGVAFLVLLKDGGTLSLSSEYTFGYLCGLGAAVTWGIYSVANGFFSKVSSSAVVGYCYSVSFLGLLAHWGLGEIWVSPDVSQWIGIICLGIAPVGLSFFVWDYGTKRGDIQLLGILSYFAPLLSTIFLIIFTPATVTSAVVIGCLGILLGAFVAVVPGLRNNGRKR